MIDITVEIRIDRRVEDVFAYVADTANEPAWNPDLLEARRTTEGPIGIGTTYQVRNKPFMGVSEGTVEVVEYEPNRRHVLRVNYGAGSMQPILTQIFEPAGGATRVTRSVQFDLPGAMRLVQPMVRFMAKQRNRASLAKLKEILEQEHGAGG